MEEKAFRLWRWRCGEDEPIIIEIGNEVLCRELMDYYATQDEQLGLVKAGSDFDGENGTQVTLTQRNPAWGIQYWIEDVGAVLYDVAFVDFAHGVYHILIKQHSREDVQHLINMMEATELFYIRIAGNNGSYDFGDEWKK